MNAVTPILTPLALNHADVLRFIADNPGADAAAIAAATQRVASNVRRDAPKLVEAGYLENHPQGFWLLTGQGEAALRAVARAEGEAASDGAIDCLHAELTPNPVNPRQEFDDVELSELAESIQTAGLLQRPLVSAADASGARMIWAGERRWRAIGRLIEAGTWPEDKPIPCQLSAEPPAELAEVYGLYIGVIENGQRANLSKIEQARGWSQLLEHTGWSTRRLASEIGKNPRVVQEDVKVIREARQEDLDAYDAGEDGWTWERLRLSVRESKPAALMEQPAQLDIEEFAPSAPPERRQLTWQEESARRSASLDRANERMRQDSQRRASEEKARFDALAAPLPGDEASLITLAREATFQFNEAICSADEAGAEANAQAYRAIIWKLNGGTFFGCNAGEGSPMDRVARAIAASPGAIPVWGQSGEFLIADEDVRALIVIRAEPDAQKHGGFSVDFHALDDRPFFSSTGYRWHHADYVLGETLENAAKRWLTSARYDYEKKRVGALVIPSSFSAAQSRPWIAGAPILDARASAEDGAALEPRARLALIELAHKSGGGDGARVGPYWTSAVAQRLQVAGLIRFVMGPEKCWLATLTEAGKAWLRAWNVSPSQVDHSDLFAARAAAHVDQFVGEYATAWLATTAPTPAPAARPAFEGDADASDDGPDDEAGDAPDLDDKAALADVKVLAERMMEDAIGVDAAVIFNDMVEDFCAFLEPLGVRGPFHVGTGGNAGALYDASGAEIATIDVNREHSDARAEAIARLIAAALNCCIAQVPADDAEFTAGAASEAEA